MYRVYSDEYFLFIYADIIHLNNEAKLINLAVKF